MNDPMASAASKPTVFINARVIDPASGRDEPGGVLVRDGAIADLGPHLRRNAPEGVEIVDCNGRIVCPGLIDMQVFTGEPGSEHRETLASASSAAAAGGVTTIVCMPDTDPVIDQAPLVDFLRRRARDTASVRVLTFAAMTRGLKGEDLTEIGLLKEAGAVAITNGKRSVSNARIMRNVLLYAKDHGLLVCHHTEDEALAGAGVMNSSEVATRLGLPGVHKTAEIIVLERDVRLVQMTGGRYHAATITCADSVAVIRQAKAKGLPVTCGASINHLTLNENDIGPYRTFFRVRPPLRSEDDRASLVRALAEGIVDVLVSSHDPQDVDGKRQPFAEAADGAIGLETLLAAALRLYHGSEIGLLELLRAMTTNPARLLGLPTGRLEKGAPADIIVFDPDVPWVVNRDELRSRSKNSPFDEQKLLGRVVHTMVAGETVYRYGERLGQ